MSRIKYILPVIVAVWLIACLIAVPATPRPTATIVQPTRQPTPTTQPTATGVPTATTRPSPLPSPTPAATATPLPTRTPQPEQFRLWVYLKTYLDDDGLLQDALKILDRAAAAGYSAVVLEDMSLESPTLPPADYLAGLKQFLDHASALHIMVVPQTYQFGWSDSFLYYIDPNLAEGLPVTGADFKVGNDGTLQFVSSFDPKSFPGGGFEHYSGVTFTDWNYQSDTGIAVDTKIVHGGKAALRLDKPAEMGFQNMPVQPYRQYHLRYWVRSRTLQGSLHVWQADTTTHELRSFRSITLSQANTWTQIDVLAYSRDSSALDLYIGRDDGYPDDTFWLDDMSIEETALVNVLRRAGTPVRIYDSNGTEYSEADNFNPIVDPLLTNENHNYSYWHEPPQVTLKTGSTLKPGTMVKMDFYFALLIDPWVPWGQIGASLTDPGIQEYMTNNINMLAKLFPADTGIFLGYDEMREMNTSEDDASRGLTAGQLLAWHVGQAEATVHKAFPGAQLYFWNDMFDPNHNAVDHYELVGRNYNGKWNGDLSGSWEGLPKDAIIFNWNLEKETVSLNFFAGKGFRQIIAGYYDSGDGTASATKELEAAQGIPNIIGMMYTTWNGDFSQLEAYAAAIKSKMH